MSRAGTTLAVACFAHFLHDGFSDLLYVLFPVWARELSLSFAQVGLTRGSYVGAQALFQIPVGILAERWVFRTRFCFAPMSRKKYVTVIAKTLGNIKAVVGRAHGSRSRTREQHGLPRRWVESSPARSRTVRA